MNLPLETSPGKVVAAGISSPRRRVFVHAAEDGPVPYVLVLRSALRETRVHIVGAAERIEYITRADGLAPLSLGASYDLQLTLAAARSLADDLATALADVGNVGDPAQAELAVGA